MNKTFELKSGMVAETINGRKVLILEAGGRLYGIYASGEKGSYESWSWVDEKRLIGTENSDFQRVFEGMTTEVLAGLSNHSVKSATVGKLLWERYKKVEVELNSQYTAVIEGDNVTVGCQVFPVSKIGEILKAHKRLDNEYRQAQGGQNYEAITTN